MQYKKETVIRQYVFILAITQLQVFTVNPTFFNMALSEAINKTRKQKERLRKIRKQYIKQQKKKTFLWISIYVRVANLLKPAIETRPSKEKKWYIFYTNINIDLNGG